jgi:predicted CXXCH cytochrome family protein
MDLERFRHDRSAYERPNFKYRCGRAALWGKPCSRGPNPDGGCGGITECAPFFNNGRWECRRPALAGGSCAEGPLPDGACSHRQPPCQPRRTLRGYRGRISLLAAMLVVILIVATFSLGGDAAHPLNSVNPGPLSGLHARFTADQGCTACHAPHGGSAGQWLAAVFIRNDMTAQCTTCHSFGGPERAPHNFAPEMQAKLATRNPEARRATECVNCHTEHRGADAKVSKIADAQCSACHAVKFAGFGAGHPAFGEHYPYETRTAINFDHVAHLGKHFPANEAAAPKDGCIGCHQVDKAGRNVPIRSFDETCASCHAAPIQSRDLVVFNLPELSPAQFAALDQDAIGKACGPRSEEAEKTFQDSLDVAKKAVAANDPQGDFQAISDKKLAPFQKWLIGAEADEIADLDPKEKPAAALLALLKDMAQDGADPFAGAIEDRLGKGRAKPMLAGLSPELVRRAACAWAGNDEYAGPKPQGPGWYVDALSLRYKPTGNADPVLRAWLGTVVDPEIGKGVGEDKAQFTEMREALLDRKAGPGACVLCHAITRADAGGSEAIELKSSKFDEPLKIEWNYNGAKSRDWVRYSHKPHLNLLGPGKNCETCHVQDQEAAYSEAFTQLNPHHYASNFKPVRMEQCTSCHGAGQVRNDCLTCHDYHREPGFRRLMIAQPGKEG